VYGDGRILDRKLSNGLLLSQEGNLLQLNAVWASGCWPYLKTRLMEDTE